MPNDPPRKPKPKESDDELWNLVASESPPPKRELQQHEPSDSSDALLRINRTLQEQVSVLNKILLKQHSIVAGIGILVFLTLLVLLAGVILKFLGR